MSLSSSTLNLKFMQRASAIKAASTPKSSTQTSTPAPASSSTPNATGASATPIKASNGVPKASSTPTAGPSSLAGPSSHADSPSVALAAEAAARWYLPRKQRSFPSSQAEGSSVDVSVVNSSQGVRFETSYMAFLDGHGRSSSVDSEGQEEDEVEVEERIRRKEMSGGGRMRFGGFGEPSRGEDGGGDDEEEEGDSEEEKETRRSTGKRGGTGLFTRNRDGDDDERGRQRPVAAESDKVRSDTGRRTGEASRSRTNPGSLAQDRQSETVQKRQFLRPGGPASPPASSASASSRPSSSSLSRGVQSSNGRTDQSKADRPGSITAAQIPKDQARSQNRQPANHQQGPSKKLSTADKLRQTISGMRNGSAGNATLSESAAAASNTQSGASSPSASLDAGKINAAGASTSEPKPRIHTANQINTQQPTKKKSKKRSADSDLLPSSALLTPPSSSSASSVHPKKENKKARLYHAANASTSSSAKPLEIPPTPVSRPVSKADLGTKGAQGADLDERERILKAERKKEKKARQKKKRASAQGAMSG